MMDIYMNLTFCMNTMFILSFVILLMGLWNGVGTLMMESIWSVSWGFCLTNISYILILLSVWIVGMMALSLHCDLLTMDVKLKLLMFLMALIMLVMFFGSSNLLIFYFFFEVSLIPTFFMVYYWGNNWERLSASFYLVMYMLFISLPLFIYLISVSSESSSLDMLLLGGLKLNKMEELVGGWDFIIIFGAFFIKLPIYMFHIWLPKAHVEAPVWGSMLLAAILLKLGGYGVLRLLQMFVVKSLEYKEVIVGISLLGTLYSSFMCLNQVDLKSLVAYSSVVHMNLMLGGMFTLLKLGAVSALVVMISHGLCSSGLFYMVNVFYCRSNSRLMVLNKGYIVSFSSIMIWWFMLCSSNFSFPFSLNFIGEISLIMVLLSWWEGLMIFLMFICFFSGAYSLYMFSGVYHGGGSLSSQDLNSFDLLLEHVSSFLHYLPLLLVMLNLFIFMF